jgi:V/A-type H+-transporting ATPase subunit I
MSVSKVKRIQLLTHIASSDALLAELQEEGLIHIDKIDIEESGLQALPTEAAELDHWLYKLNQAIGILSQWQVKGLGEKLSGRKPEVKIQARRAALEFDYRRVIADVDKLDADLGRLQGHLKFLEKERSALLPLQGMSLPIRSVSPTPSTDVHVGAVPVTRWEDLWSWAESEPVCAHVIRRDKRVVHVLLMLWAKERGRLDAELKEFSFNPQHFSEGVLKRADERDRVADVLAKMRQEEQETRLRLDELTQEGQRLAEHLDDLKRAYDVLFNEREKLESSGLLGRTRRVVFLEGWIKSSDITRLEARLGRFADAVEYYLRDPGPDEEFPVALDNRRVWRPFELITKLYGLPRGGTVDPTVPLAPFFFVFVGLTVSEAGYGLLVTLLSLLYLWLAKPKGGLRHFLILLSILGVANVIIGTLVGGWFGFPIRRLLLLDPLADPVRFLVLALALGFVQVWFGTFLAMVSKFKDREFAPGIAKCGWLLLLPGLIAYGALKQPLGGVIALVGAGAIIGFTSSSRNPLARLFGGLYGLYGISGYLSDILSYSRLLALGLATSVIAMVVNTLCQTALGIPWVGWLFAALIFVGGHLFNLGISFLGGFVHSMRLQFVEFFSKFFQSGGKPFKPFALESKYIDFIS